jgi:hypothetical protein
VVCPNVNYSIWTHNFRGVTYHKGFQPESCSLNGTQKAAIIAAGETGASVMAALSPHNAVVVVGANPVSKYLQSF